VSVDRPSVYPRSTGLVDVLDRVLDKGLVIAGDIRVSLAEVELLTIRIRLIVCSLDKANEIGLDWWRFDTHLSPGRQGTLGDTGGAARPLEPRAAAAAPAVAPRRRRAAAKRPRR